ncbi:MAG TPA: ABC transporter ATP-binding protein, partial [Sphingomonadales bacterium]|nr:ABC transporter ATP-binding protein [Sphingomonadales bacterium]
MSAKPEIFAINVKGLKKSFNGKVAVDGVELRLREGEVFGFLGPNGSGKTTTIRMICGLLRPDAGEGEVLGFDVIRRSPEIKKHIGYMTQRFSLYEELTIEENLLFVGRMYLLKSLKEKVAATLKALGLEKRKNQLAGTLSGGWKQRLALAACIMHEPRLLLLDEPTAGVDPKARRAFWDEIHVLAGKGVTVL